MNMLKFYIFVVMLLCSLTSVAQTRFVGADNDNIRYMGRVNFANRFAPMMAYPGTTITACFTGSSIAVQMKPDSGYFMVGVDHKNYHKIHFGERDSVIRIASELPEGRHIIELMLVSEEYQSQAEFYGFVIDDDAQLVDMGKDNRPLIEFIGDSMTCGYGTDDLRLWYRGCRRVGEIRSVKFQFLLYICRHHCKGTRYAVYRRGPFGYRGLPQL